MKAAVLSCTSTGSRATTGRGRITEPTVGTDTHYYETLVEVIVFLWRTNIECATNVLKMLEGAETSLETSGINSIIRCDKQSEAHHEIINHSKDIITSSA